MNVLLSVLLVCVGGHLAAASWTQAHRNQILKIHNDYRKGVKGACDMTDLTYDRSIESKARAWANRCVFEHQEKEFGENIAWYTKTGDEAKLVKEMAKMWYDEVKDYTYGMGGCGAACHYTQLIWANTKKVGCYAADCPTLRKGGKNAYFLVCFYTPPGNYMSEQPYKKVCGKNDKKKTAGSNHGSSTNNNNNEGNKNNNKQGNNNNNDNWGSWEKDFNNMGGDNWESWPEGEIVEME